MWHVSSRSGVATLRTAIHLLLTYRIRVKRCDFCGFLFQEVMQRHYLSEVGK